MSEYTSTGEGFQHAMERALTGPSEEAELYAESTSIPTFYRILNSKRISYDDYVTGIANWAW